MEHLTTTLFILLLGTITGQACYPPFQDVGGSCYYIETKVAVGWSEARDNCRSAGGDSATSDLAVFDSCDSFSFFTGYLGFIAPANSTFWVGAHTEFVANNWRWLNGVPLATGVPFWAHEQGHDSNQDCAAMDSSSYFQLSDYACDKPRNYVCHLPAVGRQHDNRDDPVNLNCPLNSVQVGDYCYWFSNNMESWSNAEDYCRNHFSKNRGELFSPSSCEEFTKMAHHLEVAERDKSHWVGAADVSGNQEWFWASGDPVPGGSPFWATSEPDDHNLSNYCGLMSHKKRFYLEDESCINLHYFICKLHVVSV